MTLRKVLRGAVTSVGRAFQKARWVWLRSRFHDSGIAKLNLCAGSQKIAGYFSIDIHRASDLVLDLAKYDLPFRSNSIQTIVCISAINYFTRTRGEELVKETHRVLAPGGIARFAVQDLENIARLYVEKDREFFFQKLPDGRERFEGPTLGDKFAAWFYGYAIAGVPCQYFYDFDALAYLFRQAGFSVVERMAYRQSRIPEIESIDNRPDQMFFLEAIK